MVGVVESHLSSPEKAPEMMPQVFKDKSYGTPPPRAHQQCCFAFIFSYYMWDSFCSALYTFPAMAHSTLKSPEVASVQLAQVLHQAQAVCFIPHLLVRV